MVSLSDKKAKKSGKRIVSSPQDQKKKNFIVTMIDLVADAPGLEYLISEAASTKSDANPKERLDSLYADMEKNTNPAKAARIAGSILHYRRAAEAEQDRVSGYKGTPGDSSELEQLEDHLCGYVKSIQNRNKDERDESLAGIKKYLSPVYYEQNPEKPPEQPKKKQSGIFDIPSMLAPTPPFRDSLTEKKKGKKDSFF